MAYSHGLLLGAFIGLILETFLLLDPSGSASSFGPIPPGAATEILLLLGAALGAVLLPKILRSQIRQRRLAVAVNVALAAMAAGLAFPGDGISHDALRTCLCLLIPVAASLQGYVLSRLGEFDIVSVVVVGFAIGTTTPCLIPSSSIAKACACIVLGLASSSVFLLGYDQTAHGDSNALDEDPSAPAQSNADSPMIRNIKVNGSMASLIDTASSNRRRILCLVAFFFAFGFMAASLESQGLLEGARCAPSKALLVGPLCALTYFTLLLLSGVPTYKRMIPPVFAGLFAIAALAVYSPNSDHSIFSAIFAFSCIYLCIVIVVSEILGTRAAEGHTPFCWIVGICAASHACGTLAQALAGASHASDVMACAYGISLVVLLFLIWESNLSDSANQSLDVGDIAERYGPLSRRSAWVEARYYHANSDEGAIRRTCSSLANRYALSKRESEVLELMAGGATHKQIAESLCVSESTVKTHARNLYRKLDVNGQAELIRKCAFFTDSKS